MRKGNIYSLVAVFLILMSSCGVQLQTYDLSEDYAIGLHNQEEPAKKGTDKKEEDQSEKSALIGVTARSFYGGDLKRGGIWWASKGIYIERGDTFAIEVTHVGADSLPSGATNPSNNLDTHPFGATFPPIDMIKEPVMLKIIARAESKDTTPAVLYVQLVDADGYKTNSKLPFNKIENSTEFKEYFFDLRDVYMQNDPEKHKVNGALINGVQFFINPKEFPGYSGNIYISEIRVVPAPPVTK
ncbi:MAG: hypothetical protein JWM14_1649 [Chitinophagaceae bacterium]|nr:hypothetical protein [Chitinophagaceae bacterium]